MELRHLRYFLAVVEHGTVTAAAERLHVAQPAVSRQLRALERDVGVALFTRDGPRLALTHAGRRMLEVATDLVRRADRAEMAARELADGGLARVSVAAAATTITEVLAPFVATLSMDDPFISTHAVAADGVHEAARKGHDLGISATEPPSSVLEWRMLTSVPLRAYVSRAHPWARRRRATVRVPELLTADLILPPRQDPTRRVLDAAVNAASLSYGPFEEVPWPRLRQALAAAGRGVAVVTDLPHFDGHPVFVVDGDRRPVQLAIHACWDPTHHAAAAIEALVERLAAFADTTIRDAAWASPSRLS